ncbi:MAG: hypothetical protein OER80_04225 [Gammaproteobacteria bacterium]|nr:hypothetical protein [Gammaproteobacteria bacterium]
MSIKKVQLLCALAFVFSNNAWSHSSDTESLRAAIDELRTDYETRITALEKRLVAAEQNSRSAPDASAPAPTLRGDGAASAFNPAIGVIFQGQAWNYAGSPDEDYFVPGFPFGGEAGLIDEGFAIAESEINISANVDDKFTAWLTVPVVVEDGEAGVEVEEAWIETTALPAGLSARFGRFFSGVGYLNDKHAHSWDFADQPLPYQAFLGDQYLDDGVQIRWIAPTDLYIEAGAEVFRGSRYPAAGAARSGAGADSIFLNIGADAGNDSSWLAGVSHLRAQSVDRSSGSADEPLLFSGDTDTTIAQLVWKWAPNGNWKQRNLVLQTEWLWRSESGFYALPDSSPFAYKSDQSGWYLQATYQPMPRWRYGARIDALSMDNIAGFFAGSSLASPVDDPMRYSLMADWSNSEFSRLRLQFTRDEAASRHQNQWGLQYILSIGAHGGHSF